MSRAAAFSASILLVLSAWPLACARAPVTTHGVRQLIPANLRVRRPEGLGADPKAGPGGIDYTSHPLPNETLDCEKAGSLFKGVDWSGLRSCIDLLQLEKEPLEVRYRLRRPPQPFLELQKTEKTPECLVNVLPKIAVPREIVFQTAQPDGTGAGVTRYPCYTSRLEIEADEVLGFKAPKAKAELIVRFPLALVPKDDEGLERMLVAWALTPLWGGNPTDQVLPSKVLPDALCKRCIGEKELMNKLKSAPVYWP